MATSETIDKMVKEMEESVTSEALEEFSEMIDDKKPIPGGSKAGPSSPPKGQKWKGKQPRTQGSLDGIASGAGASLGKLEGQTAPKAPLVSSIPPRALDELSAKSETHNTAIEELQNYTRAQTRHINSLEKSHQELEKEHKALKEAHNKLMEQMVSVLQGIKQLKEGKYKNPSSQGTPKPEVKIPEVISQGKKEITISKSSAPAKTGEQSRSEQKDKSVASKKPPSQGWF